MPLRTSAGTHLCFPPVCSQSEDSWPSSATSNYADDGLKYYDLVSGKGQQVQSGSKATVHFDCMYKGLDVVSTRSARLLGGNRTIAEVRVSHSPTLYFLCLSLHPSRTAAHAQQSLLCYSLCSLQPFEFIAGEVVGGKSSVVADTANGLFAGGSGPRPPPALSTAVLGMKVGGKVGVDAGVCGSLHAGSRLSDKLLLACNNAGFPNPTRQFCFLFLLQRSVLVPPELGYGAKGEQEVRGHQLLQGNRTNFFLHLHCSTWC